MVGNCTLSNKGTLPNNVNTEQWESFTIGLSLIINI